MKAGTISPEKAPLVDAAAMHVRVSVAELLSGVVKPTLIPDPIIVEFTQLLGPAVTLPLKFMDL